MITIDINKLPDKSYYVTTKSEAEEAIKEYGNNIRFVWKYNTTVVVSLDNKKYLSLPSKSIIYT